jgi:hypothetical protein
MLAILQTKTVTNKKNHETIAMKKPQDNLARGNELQCFLGIEVIRDQDLAKLILICREVAN